MIEFYVMTALKLKQIIKMLSGEYIYFVLSWPVFFLSTYFFFKLGLAIE